MHEDKNKDNLAEEKKEEERLYFSIGEVSRITGVPSYVLRFWEKSFPSLSPRKSKGGHRRYRKEDVELVLKIKDLLYNKGFTIEGAKKTLKEKKKGREEIEIDLDWLRKEIEEIYKLLD
ncbi:MerR family transcriptional regulator [Candidatus Aerophobetes bacterium]|uniref:MerR family transcriptional regulator n=1 Tax=Aerophobetes bacterium TaxID=2030807 RepID=A0A7V5HZX8_UNCAE|nr:MerR family transcriptional regulator [Candidatus Aerophobetes bacterium]HHF99048.1 MerR family transcriptional regulator [Candidatus Aerophobetes bacterium]